MRETDFIKQNIKKWFDLEQTLNSKTKDPDELSRSFIEVTDDLSYARTFYPNRSVRVYLNGIAQKLTQDLYTIKKPNKKKLTHFFIEDLPAVIHQCRKPLLFALVVFVVAVLIGLLSSIYDKNFASTILGSDYVNMTEENIKNNDPMGVYKGQSQVQMMLYIGWNNITIAFKAFVFGALFGIGTLAIMLTNGVMLGTFQYFFFERGYFTQSFLTIWLHGVPEIAAIIISGGCGFILAQGLIFPGTYSRIQSFRIRAYSALKIMVSLVIILAFAAFVESFITRYTEIPQWVRAIFIILELVLILGYFVYLPIVKNHKSKKSFLSDEHFTPPKVLPLDFKNIKSNGEIFSMIFQFYQNNFTKIFRFIVTLTIFFSTYLFYNIYITRFENFQFGLNYYFYIINFLKDENPWEVAFVVIMIGSILLFAVSLYLKLKEQTGVDNFKVSASSLLGYVAFYLWKTILIVSIMYSLILLPTAASIFQFLLLTPFLLLWNFIVYKEEKNIVVSLLRAFKLISAQLGKVYGLFSVLLILCSVFFLLLSSPIISMNIWSIGLHVSFDQGLLNIFLKILLFLLTTLSIALIAPILIIGMGLVYFSLFEIVHAVELKEKINQMGNRKKYYGLSRENS